MSNNLAKRFDKIIAKWRNKAKEAKLNDTEISVSQWNEGDATANGNRETQHESILRRVKGRLDHTRGSVKREHHLQVDASPHHITDELKRSPFKGKPLLRISIK